MGPYSNLENFNAATLAFHNRDQEEAKKSNKKLKALVTALW